MRIATPDPNIPLRRSACALLATALLQATAIWFHPQAPAATPIDWVQGLAEIGPRASHLHLVLVATVVATWLLLGDLGRHWPSQALARGAERLYALGAAAMIAGAMINGFALSRVARWAVMGGASHAEGTDAVVTFAFALNQALAGLGLVATCLAILAWSLGLRHCPGRWARAACVGGIGIAALCIAGYALGPIKTDVTGIATVTLAQCTWYALVALAVLRGGASAGTRFPSASPRVPESP
ncbi:MAG: hypothetical protein J0M21_06945 [Xanthomonadales bacterium]|nr:hypothetical protein [Xanthomonadales bacterium]